MADLPLEIYSMSRPFARPELSASPESAHQGTIHLTMSGSVPSPVSVSDLTEQMARRLQMLYELPLKFAAEKDLSRLCSLILEQVIALIPGAVRGALRVKDSLGRNLSLRAAIP